MQGLFLIMFFFFGFCLPEVAFSQQTQQKKTSFPLGPYPIETQVQALFKEAVVLELYPRIAGIYDNQHQPLASSGVLFEQGFTKIYIQNYPNANPTIVAKSYNGQLFDQQDQQLGFFVRNGIEVLSYDSQRKWLGKTRCLIAWEVCGALATAYLLDLVP